MKYKLLPLYPKKNEDYNSESELLLSGVKDKEIKNIGIVAHYGAGKSSLLKTFRENNSSKDSGLKFLNVSLASFNNDSNSSKALTVKSEIEKNTSKFANGGVQDLDNAVEKSILQQMLYRKEKDDLPKSQIKRNNNFVASKFALYFFLIITAAICAASFILYSLNFNNIEILRFEFWDVAYLMVGIISFIIFVVLLLATISFSKFSFKGIELELNGNSESLLNKFLDEIIYFFQKTKYNVVIFEDLERFDNLSIFSKLRELNSILNNNELISKNGKITFIYAVKDDMFANCKDRAKFFDLILPVFSVLSPLNVRSQITSALEESNLGKDWLTKSFIHDISFYISDMRVLNNIVNDCVTLCCETDLAKLHGDSAEEKHIQLFSIMAYKNLFPKDFALFEEDKGDFYLLMDQADKLRSQDLSKNLSQISQFKDDIKLLKSNIKNNPAYATTYKSQITQKQLELDKLYDSNKNCAGVISYIKNNTEVVFSGLKDKDTNDLKPVYKLLKMLIHFGYIKDSFRNYIYKIGDNFFAENDEKYTHILLDRESPQFNLKLNNIKIILEDLSADKLLSESALNFDMVNYLFSNTDVKFEHLVAFKRLLVQNSKIVEQFILEYIQAEENWSKDFIKFLITENENTLSMVLDSSLAETKIEKFFNYILTNYSSKDIANQNELENFVGYILKSEALLSIIEGYSTQLTLLKSYGFEIDNLNKFNFPDSAIRLIEQNNVWEVNYKNVCTILNKFYGYSKGEIDKGGITFIKSIKNKHLSDYILQDNENYITKVMLKADSFDISANDFKNIILDNKLSIDIRKEVIKKQIAQIDYFAGCSIDILQYLLEQNKIKATLVQLNNLIQTNNSLKLSVAIYLKNNYELFKGNAITTKNLVLCIVNSGIFAEGQSLTEIYLDEIKSNLPLMREIDNDESIAVILKDIAPNIYQEDIQHISDKKFVKSSLILALEYMPDILKNNHETNWLVHMCIKNNPDKNIRAKIYQGKTLDLSNDDYAIIKPIVNDICENKFQITDKLYSQLTKFKLDERDRKELLLSQLDYMSNDRLLNNVTNLGGLYFKLIDTGEILLDDDMLYKDPIILALDHKGLIKKRKKKNKYSIKLAESSIPKVLVS